MAAIDDHEPLVVLQPGRRGATPLFCVAGAGASVTGFFEVAANLSPEVPLLGLQARGLDGSNEPYRTVEEAAATYLEAVREVWSEGPCRILGHSFGGWIGYELAERLREAGRPVEALFLVDSMAPYEPGVVAPEISRVDALTQLVHLYELLIDAPLALAREDFEPLGEGEQIDRLQRELMRVGVLPRNAPGGMLEGVVAVFEANVRTTYHAAGRFDGPVWLLNAEVAEDDVDARIAGWRRLAPSLCAAATPGNHVTMLMGENAGRIATWLSERLESRVANGG